MARRFLVALLGFIALPIGCGDDDGARRFDGGTDGGAPTECFTNADCDDGLHCNGEETCDPTASEADPVTHCVAGAAVVCDDGIACTVDECIESSRSCLSEPPDDDSDGHTDGACLDGDGEPLGDDCDDSDPGRYPGNLEVCVVGAASEAVDEDCDPTTFGLMDEDGDGAIDSACCNTDDATDTQLCGSDCDDTNLAVHGRQPEFCDGIDNDCDNAIDEVMNVIPWYADDDGDLFGAGEDFMESCVPIPGRSLLSTDCDDSAISRHPAQLDICDGIDNDCDETVDENLTNCATTPEEPPPARINECANGLDNCHATALCRDRAMGFTCSCRAGFMGDGLTECIAISACVTNNGGCDPIATCADGTGGARTCTCPADYETADNGMTCTDVNECATNNGGCGNAAFYSCSNNPGAAATCSDIDECTANNGGCDPLVACTNNVGLAPSCAACPVGYLGAGDTGCIPALLALVPSAGALSPAFEVNTTAYTINAGLLTQAIMLSATAPAAATVAINGETLSPGTPWQTPTLNIGSNVFAIVVSQPGHANRDYTVTVMRGPNQQGSVVGASSTGGDLVGFSVAISGDTLVVGAPNEDSDAVGINGDGSNDLSNDSGAAYVFVRSGDTWTQQAYLKASNTDVSDEFGRSVAIDGDTIVVGAYHEDSSIPGINGNGSDNGASFAGAAYVFVRSDGTWTQQAYLKASNPSASDEFGSSVAISGDTVAIGAYLEDSASTGVNGTQGDESATNAGAVYVFTRDGITWSQQAYLKASNTGANDRFGREVAISGDTLIAGAYFEDSIATGINGDETSNGAADSGAAYIFVRNGLTWSQQAYVKASNTEGADFFGWSVGISGDTVVVGARDESSAATTINGDGTNNTAADSGAAYVFVRSGMSWSQQAYLKASNTDPTDRFGWSVSISGDAIVVGARQEDSAATGIDGDSADDSAADSGAAYAFTRSGFTWTQRAYIKASDPAAADDFGRAIAISGDTWVVGAPEHTTAVGNSGAIYVFR